MTVKKKKMFKAVPGSRRAKRTRNHYRFGAFVLGQPRLKGGKTNGRREKELNRNMNGRNKLKSVPGNAHDAKPRLHDDGRNGI